MPHPLTSPGSDTYFQNVLKETDLKGQMRSLAHPFDPESRITGGKTASSLIFSSNDYLGLSRHPALAARACAYIQRWGTGSQASRLVGGDLSIHHDLERKIAAAKGTEAALLFSSGFQANSQVLMTLLGGGKISTNNPSHPPIVLCDRLSHASIYQGLIPSGAKILRYHHGDLDHLETLLRSVQTNSSRAPLWIVTESVFSMDGDQTSLQDLINLKHRYGARLYLDEAHATGVLGPSGYGLAAAFPGEVDVVMGTFGKALGGFGAYIASSRLICQFLINRCPGFMFTTALPPAVVGAADAAWDLLPTLDETRTTLLQKAAFLRGQLESLSPGATLQSTTPIIPWVVGEAQETLRLAAVLLRQGMYVSAIRPPTVPLGSSRLRLAVTAQHTYEDLERLLAGLRSLSYGA